MLNWLKNKSKGKIELNVERLEAFVHEHGPRRRAAIAVYTIWMTGRLRDFSFREAFFEGHGCSMQTASHVLAQIDGVREQHANVAKQMKVIRRRLELHTDDQGNLEDIIVWSFDLIAATVGVAMRPDLRSRVAYVWRACLFAAETDAELLEVIHWFEREGNVANEMGANSPVVTMSVEEFGEAKLPTFVRASIDEG